MPERYVGVSNMTELEWAQKERAELRAVLKRLRNRLDKLGISFHAVLTSAPAMGAIPQGRLERILADLENIEV